MVRDNILTIGSLSIVVLGVASITFLSANAVEVPDVLIIIITSVLGFLGGVRVPNNNDDIE